MITSAKILIKEEKRRTLKKELRKKEEKEKKKLIAKEIRFVVTRGRGVGRGDWMKTVKRHTLPVLSTRDVMYNIINVINTAIYYIKV